MKFDRFESQVRPLLQSANPEEIQTIVLLFLKQAEESEMYIHQPFSTLWLTLLQTFAMLPKAVASKIFKEAVQQAVRNKTTTNSKVATLLWEMTDWLVFPTWERDLVLFVRDSGRGDGKTKIPNGVWFGIAVMTNKEAAKY